MFSIEALNADEGDCLWIEYGTSAPYHRILIDGGRARTYQQLKSKALQLPSQEREFELLVVSHIDRDHIEGILSLLEDPEPPLTFKEIWFNGYHHLHAADIQTYSPIQGERLSTQLQTHSGWNKSFNGTGVVLTDSGIRTIQLPGGASLHLVSPNQSKLDNLRVEWQRAIDEAGLLPTHPGRHEGGAGLEVMSPIDIRSLAHSPFQADNSKPNGSSIAFVLEFEGHRALCAADAHVDLLIERIPFLPGFDSTVGRLPVKLFKLPHHGSSKNCSKQLLDLLDCPRFLISTNGNYFNHPDREAVARVIEFGGSTPQLFFNYRSEETEVWDDARLKRRHGYETHFADTGQGIKILLD